MVAAMPFPPHGSSCNVTVRLRGTSIEGGAGPRCDGAQVRNDLRRQRHAADTAHGFGGAFGVAWDERPRRAVCGPRATKDAHPVINLPFELFDLDEAVNAEDAEEMAQPFADAALRPWQVMREGRDERPPVGTAQNAA